MPCGYTKHCCVEEDTPAGYNAQEMKETLEALKDFYADEYWNT